MNKTQKKFSELIASIPEETKRYVSWQGKIAVRVVDRLQELGWTQKKLAELMGWNESQVTRLVAGHDNLTLKTLAKLSTILGTGLISVGDLTSASGQLLARIYIGGSDVVATVSVVVSGESRPLGLKEDFSGPQMTLTKGSAPYEKRVA